MGWKTTAKILMDKMRKIRYNQFHAIEGVAGMKV